MRKIIPLIAVIALSTLLLAAARPIDPKDVETYKNLMSQIHEPTLLAPSIENPPKSPDPDDTQVLKSTLKSMKNVSWFPGPTNSGRVFGHAGKFKIGFSIDQFANAGDEIHIIQYVDVDNTLGYEKLYMTLWSNPKTQKIIPILLPIPSSMRDPAFTDPPRHPSTQPYWPSFIQPDADAIAQCKQIALKSYQSLMKDLKIGAEKPSDPVAFVTKFEVDNLGLFYAQNPLWEISIQSEAGQLMGLFWYNPLNQKIKPLIGPWKTEKPQLIDWTPQ